MASYNPPKKNVAYRMFVGLRSQADTRLFQVNPTLASGDAKVSKDGGALANLTTLPSVIGSSAIVQIDLSSTEMNADNVTIVLSDAAGGQWCDLVINLQTAANQFDDVALASALATVNAYVDELESRLTAARAGYLDNLSGGAVALASALATVNAYVDELESRLTAARAGYLDNLSGGAVALASALATVNAYVDELESRLTAARAGYLDSLNSGVPLAAGAITEAKFSSGGLNAIADAILKRDWTQVTGEASRSVLNALRFLRNKWTAIGATLTVMKEDDSTTAWTAAITKDAASDPITGSDPN